MDLKTVRNYIDGSWTEASDSRYLEVENPSTGQAIARTPLSPAHEVDRTVQAAARAFAQWSRTPVSRRVQPLHRLAALLRQHEDEIARQLVQEMGKSLPDAYAEMKRIFENIEVACGMPIMQMGDKLLGSAQGIDGEVLRLPMGVFAMIAPFNFPGMVPFWFLPYALATGNTFIVKASEQVPLTMEMITRYIDEAGFPPGVFNLINGDRTAAGALVSHDLVKGVSIVGSSKTCRAVYEHCARAHKRCQALGSAKNHLVAMDDAKMDDMIRNMVTSCYGCAGQRCMASSAIVAVGDDMYQRVCEAFVKASKEVITADPLDPQVAQEAMVMGPVISAKSKAFILKMIETGIKEGASLALDGRDLQVPGCEQGHFIGPTVFTDVSPGMDIHSTEIFGPVVVMLKADSLDQAIQIINDHPYGNGASIYTQNGYWARKFKIEVDCGMIGVNVGIPAPVSCLPFGGMKDSLFADIKAQGKSVVNFFTEEKIITERYWP